MHSDLRRHVEKVSRFPVAAINTQADHVDWLPERFQTRSLGLDKTAIANNNTMKHIPVNWTQTENIREQGAEENTWTQDGWSNKVFEEECIVPSLINYNIIKMIRPIRNNHGE
jgi:hypothetical protein